MCFLLPSPWWRPVHTVEFSIKFQLVIATWLSFLTTEMFMPTVRNQRRSTVASATLRLPDLSIQNKKPPPVIAEVFYFVSMVVTNYEIRSIIPEEDLWLSSSTCFPCWILRQRSNCWSSYKDSLKSLRAKSLLRFYLLLWVTVLRRKVEKTWGFALLLYLRQFFYQAPDVLRWHLPILLPLDTRNLSRRHGFQTSEGQPRRPTPGVACDTNKFT